MIDVSVKCFCFLENKSINKVYEYLFVGATHIFQNNMSQVPKIIKTSILIFQKTNSQEQELFLLLKNISFKLYKYMLKEYSLEINI